MVIFFFVRIVTTAPHTASKIENNNEVDLDDGNWHHVIVSADMTVLNKVDLYIDDTQITPTISVFTTGSTLNIGGGTFYLGQIQNGNSKLEADIADFWIDTGTYIDLSVEANRRKFIDAAGNPVDLGSDGSAPTGSSPELFLSGDTATWHTNDGAGGGFSEIGALTDAATDPPSAVHNGLIGHWKLDETSGTTAADSAGSNDGTMQGTLDAANDSAPGAVGTALVFDGIDDEIQTASHSPGLANQPFTVSLWAKREWTTNTLGFAFNYDLGGNNSEIQLGFANNRFRCGFRANDLDTTTSYPETDWHHWVCTFDPTTKDRVIYRDGVQVAADVSASNMTGVTGSLHIGGIAGGSFLFRGSIDDVRVYNRVLSTSEIQQLYNMGAPIGSVTSLPQGCPSIGDVCDDGTIYVGLSSDGNIAMFAAPEDAPGGKAYTWNDGNTNWSTTGATDNDDGDGNTATIVVTDSDDVTAGFQTHEAAQYCYDLVSNGADDWYLPGYNELITLMSAAPQIGMLDGSGVNFSYWSSDEANNSQAYRRATGGGGSNGKDSTMHLRCVRKGPAPRCANPYGVEGQMIYNSTSDVAQYCDGARWIAVGKEN